MANNRSVNQGKTKPPRTNVKSWQISKECELALNAAKKVTKKRQSFLIDRCLVEQLPHFVQDWLARKADPLRVKNGRGA